MIDYIASADRMFFAPVFRQLQLVLAKDQLTLAMAPSIFSALVTQDAK
jgi:hypothetical protein